MVNTEIIACYLVALECMFKTVEVYQIFFLLNILKRSHDCLLHTKKDRNCDLFAVKITACPALLLPLVKTFLTLAVTFTSLVYFMNENTRSRDNYGMRRHVMQT